MCSIATSDVWHLCRICVCVVRSEARGQCHLQPGVSDARMLLGALLTSVLASILIYGLQLRLSCWGRTRHSGQHRNMGASHSLSRGTKTSPPPTRHAEGGVTFQKEDHGRVKSDKVENKEDEKLTITIITNKEPIIEKVTSEDDKKANSASTSKCRFSKICRYFKNRKKRVVNFPYSEWSGKVHCSITKTVNLWADSKCKSVNIGGYEHKKFFLIIK